MKQKLNKDFFTGSEVLFMGYAGGKSKNLAFSRQVYQAFMNNGIRVFPVNRKTDENYDVKVYHDMAELPKVPSSAYLLLNSESTQKAVPTLAQSGVKKILFQNAKNVMPQTLEYCKSNGIETAVACPMMIFGSGLHRLHAFFAGVQR